MNNISILLPLCFAPALAFKNQLQPLFQDLVQQRNPSEKHTIAILPFTETGEVISTAAQDIDIVN